ncbi:MAG: carbon monoxide dehydrogenase subunit G [Thaumarchaeota archaeon]|nr:carbon monoxide dehydrogenase subunit G [Candidatus Calditenuaceae archaeon]MDW8041232.1 carbon monoxide dehydrogenase subunit G [Nitrososphaerota archaeon]
MKFEGAFEVNAPPEQVFRVARDPMQFSKAIPDVKKVTVQDKDRFNVEFVISLGPIRGNMKVDFKYEESIPNSRVLVAGKGSGLQSTVNLRIDANIEPLDAGSRVKWTADLTVGGLIASVGGRLIESVTKDKVTEIINNLKKLVEKGSK